MRTYFHSKNTPASYFVGSTFVGDGFHANPDFNPVLLYKQMLIRFSFCALEGGATHVDTSVLGSKYPDSLNPAIQFLP